MRIFVDADSCPVRIRSIICKAAARLKTEAVFTANRAIPFPQNKFTKMVITEAELQSADEYIIYNAEKGDIVVTRDIPLAKQLVDRGIVVINDRGTCFTQDNIKSVLSLRNFMYELHENGLSPEKTSFFGKKEVQKFATCFDSEIAKLLKPNQQPQR